MLEWCCYFVYVMVKMLLSGVFVLFFFLSICFVNGCWWFIGVWLVVWVLIACCFVLFVVCSCSCCLLVYLVVLLCYFDWCFV